MTINKTIHVFRDDALSDHDAVALSKLIKKKHLNPTELVSAAIARAKKVNPSINAIEEEGFDQALQLAKKVDISDGFFSGIPTFIKDNTNLVGFGTNHGSRSVSSEPAKTNSAFAKQYLNQGFVSLGKSRLPEFGFIPTTEYSESAPARNPWGLDYSTGGSSGGSAALVAAGVVPVAHANDGGGSIRIPAACCGLIGLKASRGRCLDSEQAQSMPINIINDGLVSRSVRDTAYFFFEAEKYYKNSKLSEIGLVEGPGNNRLRIGLIKESITGHPIDNETKRVLNETVSTLIKLGHQVEEINLDVLGPNITDDFTNYWAMLAFAVHYFGKNTVDKNFDSSKLEAFTLGLSNRFKRNFYKLPMILYRLNQSYNNYSKIFNTCDVTISPLTGHVTPKLGELNPGQTYDELYDKLIRYVGFTPLANASGGPAISLPVGTSKSSKENPDNAGLPIAMQFSSNHGQEKLLSELAYELEQEAPWRKIYTGAEVNKAEIKTPEELAI